MVSAVIEQLEPLPLMWPHQFTPLSLWRVPFLYIPVTKPNSIRLVSHAFTNSSEESIIPTIEERVNVSPTDIVNPEEVAVTFVNWNYLYPAKLPDTPKMLIPFLMLLAIKLLSPLIV